MNAIQQMALMLTGQHGIFLTAARRLRRCCRTGGHIDNEATDIAAWSRWLADAEADRNRYRV